MLRGGPRSQEEGEVEARQGTARVLDGPNKGTPSRAQVQAGLVEPVGAKRSPTWTPGDPVPTSLTRPPVCRRAGSRTHR